MKLVQQKSQYIYHGIRHIIWLIHTSRYKKTFDIPFTSSEISDLFVNYLDKDGCLTNLIYETAHERCNNILSKKQTPIINLLEILNSQNASRWHLIDEIIYFQSKEDSNEPTALNKNLLYQLSQDPNQALLIIKKWHEEQIKNEISQKIIAQLKQVQGITIDTFITEIITKKLFEYKEKLLPLLHKRSNVQPSLDSLLANMKSCLSSHSRWSNTTEYQEQITKNLCEIIDQWTKNARIELQKSAIYLKNEESNEKISALVQALNK